MALNATHEAFAGFAIDGKPKKIAQSANLWTVMRGSAAENEAPTVMLDFDFVWQVCGAACMQDPTICLMRTLSYQFDAHAGHSVPRRVYAKPRLLSRFQAKSCMCALQDNLLPQWAAVTIQAAWRAYLIRKAAPPVPRWGLMVIVNAVALLQAAHVPAPAMAYAAEGKRQSCFTHINACAHEP